MRSATNRLWNKYVVDGSNEAISPVSPAANVPAWFLMIPRNTSKSCHKHENKHEFCQLHLNGHFRTFHVHTSSCG